jgi:tRNA1(Val) A37 N6-methylase TrmN6
MPEPSATRNGRTGQALTDDALAGDFRVLQRRRGHRYSLDDVVTAYLAAHACPQADSVLDLGSGIGSVLLMLGYKLRGARLCAVEAQRESFELLQDNVQRNGVSQRSWLRWADLRDPAMLRQLARDAGCDDGFALVTGTPPYMPPGRGPISPDPQRAHARVELRGGVEAYLSAAAAVVGPAGRVVVCADARRPERVGLGAVEAGLAILERTDVIPIAGHKGALFSVFVLARSGATTSRSPRRRPDFVARDRNGARTSQALALRRFFGLPVDEAEPASPRLRSRRQTLAS